MKNYLCALLFLSFSCSFPQNNQPVDSKATKETVSLYRNLKKIMERGYMIGHQDALAYGVNWKYEPGRSDIKDITGDYPAVYGWELGHLELGNSLNLDSVPFDKMRAFIKEGYQRGGVITISWHGDNPLTGESAWAPKPGTVSSILPGGEKNSVFNEQLDKIAEFMLSLKGDNGELIPVLFRPFHENTGNWFWWGSATTSDEEYIELFRYTVEYLKNTKQVHNLLYVFNTGTEFSNEEEYLKRYPGDDVIDVISFDIYQQGDGSSDTTFTAILDQRLGIIESLATKKNKIPVLAETGYNRIPYADWWTKKLLPGIDNHRIAYVLFWRNAGLRPVEKDTEFFAPYRGHLSEADFLKLYNLPETLFQNDITFDELYR